MKLIIIDVTRYKDIKYLSSLRLDTDGDLGGDQLTITGFGKNENGEVEGITHKTLHTKDVVTIID